MIISRGRFRRIVQAIQSSNDTAVYLGDTNNLVDGIPSTGCAIQWPSGIQNTTVYVKIPWRMDPTPTRECRIFALLGLRGVPAGTVLELVGGNSPDPSTFIANAVVVELPGGELGAWVVLDIGAGLTRQYYAWVILNDDGSGGSAIAAEAVVDVGEVYASPAWDWCATDISIDIVDQSLVNTAAGGASRRVQWTPYRACQVSISPQAWTTAVMDTTNGLQSLQYDLLAQDNVVLVPRPRWPPGGGIDQTAVEETAMFGVLTRVGGLSSNAQLDRWPLQVGMQESP